METNDDFYDDVDNKYDDIKRVRELFETPHLLLLLLLELIEREPYFIVQFDDQKWLNLSHRLNILASKAFKILSFQN